MKKIALGILAHVDAGKTTLSEALLYRSGSIRKLGRVDNQDTFLDTYNLEKERGITIFSKLARLNFYDTEVTLLDTPGHVDFSAEMERTLQVMDYAILVISGSDGVQGHTITLWNLLKSYDIPVFIFVNKMDQALNDREKLMEGLREAFGSGCVEYQGLTEEFYENVALCDDRALDEVLENKSLSQDTISRLVADRKLFLCYFGSALKIQGVDELMEGIAGYTRPLTYDEEFGARVFKIARDENNNRLTYMKITGGRLQVRSSLKTGEDIQEKVNQIRLYSGARYETVNEIGAGGICAVTGLENTYAGQGLGCEEGDYEAVLEPVLSYELILPGDCDALQFYGKLKGLKEEDPKLGIEWNEEHRCIEIKLMGQVQTEVVKHMVRERFDVDISFGPGNIVYKETIEGKVEGVGHYEPLRHYAEVHLIIEAGERGSGIVLDCNCSEDILDKNWQRLILTHLQEKVHRGVLTGSAVTDIKITVAGGRAHLKHTEGGDFREATYRAVRNGLMKAQSVLLEPYYKVKLEVPTECIGRAMNDLQQRNGHVRPAQIGETMAQISAIVPVACMHDYAKEVAGYTGGRGRLVCNFGGYGVCHNPQEVMEKIGYDASKDTDNPASSVFCSHGAGFIVEWDQVEDYMHVENVLAEERITKPAAVIRNRSVSDVISQEEIEEIFATTFNSNRKNKNQKKYSYHRSQSVTRYVGSEKNVYSDREKYLLVDGYNIIFAWDELNELAKDNVDGARGRLQDILCNYQGIKKCNIIVVFDAYRVKGHDTEIFDYHNIHVVFTREAETADQYIEKFAHENGRKYDVTVATSDGLEQIIIRGQGCKLMSARELYDEVNNSGKAAMEAYESANRAEKNRPFQQLLDALGENAQN